MRKLTAVISMAVLGALALAGSSSAAVTVGHSAWSWGNPQPQGNTLNAIEFAGGRGYAAGNFGTVLRTDNGGLNWSGVATGVTLDLTQIRALDADTVFIGAGCLLRRSDDGGVTFRRLSFTPSERQCGAGLAAFYFPTDDIGYLVLTDGTVLRTANATQVRPTFTRRTAVPGTAATNAPNPANPTDIWFTGPDVGYATVDQGPGGGAIYRTTDGGNTWNPVHNAATGLNGLFFASADVGYAVGNAKTLLRTTDGGQNWTVRPVPADIPPADLNRIRCAN